MGSRLDTGRRYTVKAFFFIKKKYIQVPQAHYKKRKKIYFPVKKFKKINNVE